MAIQSRLAAEVREETPAGAMRYVAGVDAAFTRDKRSCIASAVVWDKEARLLMERTFAVCDVIFPYIPGLLSFREAPAVLAALEKLSRAPDALICDGQGKAHPRRFGLACHVGVLCDVPTVGCGKSKLIGELDAGLAVSRGSWAWLWDGGEKIGMALRTRRNVKPVFVSVGHKFDPESACALVLDCAYRYRLPEPTRLADYWVGQAKKERAC